MTSLRNEMSAAVTVLWKKKIQTPIAIRNVRRNFTRKSKNNYLFASDDLPDSTVLYSGFRPAESLDQITRI